MSTLDFDDPGVTNGDVDWLFRGREVKKLRKKVKSVNKQAQTQLEDAQQELRLRRSSEGKVKVSEGVEKGPAEAARAPLKPSLKPSGSPASAGSAGSRSSSKSPKAPRREEARTRTRAKDKSEAAPATPARKTSIFSSFSSKKKRRESVGEKPVPFPGSLNPVPLAKTPEQRGGFLGMRRRRSSGGSSVSSVGSERRSQHSGEEAESVAGVSASEHHSHHHHHHHHDHKKMEEVFEPTLPSTPEAKLAQISFKRVTFALDKMGEEPQQQIPSRRPKRGNVVTPEDLTAPLSKLSVGIADSSESHNRSNGEVDPRILNEAKERQRRASAEARKHAEDAHMNAVKLAREVARYKKGSKKGGKEAKETAEVEESTFSGGKFDIDTPFHEHVNYYKKEEEGEETAESASQQSAEAHELTLEELYTRCCHLREILPIPVTLKQLKGKKSPLHVLKMLNPRPTLIDVMSFCDFLSIAPVVTVIFDNVTLTTEMLKIVLSSLSRSAVLEKLSLRNLPIAPEGWQCLCKFLTVHRDLAKLDISQQKVKADMAKECLRSRMDWDLFSYALEARGGIQELVINGCRLSGPQFHKLVERGLSIGTKRLGVAATELDAEKSQILCNWISAKDTTCVGVDIAFNDLSGGQMAPFNRIFTESPDSVKLMLFSLNKTQLSVAQARETIANLANLKWLRFLDLGNNPQLFPDIIPALQEYLPRFPDLRRIHFEFDSLSEVSIVKLAFILRSCPKLVHVSLLGNTQISPKSSVALYGAIRSSNIYNLDLDYNLVDEELASKMAFYLMRNMERFLNSDGTTSHAPPNDEDLIFDGRMLAKAAENLLESRNAHSKEEMGVIWDSLTERTERLRKDIHQTISQLFRKHSEGTLSIEGKEQLLRLCLLDDSMDNILGIFQEETNKVKAEKVQQEALQQILLQQHLPPHGHMHEGSNDVISTGPIVSPSHETLPRGAPTEEESAPHQVVEDANMNPVDESTGKPVLLRSASQTSMHGKQLEEEEGEFHRWGFFVQQQEEEDDTTQIESQKEKLKQVTTIPSGPALREAVMKAKGIESIADLITKVSRGSSPDDASLVKMSSDNENGAVETVDPATTTPLSNETARSPSISERLYSAFVGRSESPDTGNDTANTADHDPNTHAEKVYEKLLQNAAKERIKK